MAASPSQPAAYFLCSGERGRVRRHAAGCDSQKGVSPASRPPRSAVILSETRAGSVRRCGRSFVGSGHQSAALCAGDVRPDAEDGGPWIRYKAARRGGEPCCPAVILPHKSATALPHCRSRCYRRPICHIALCCRAHTPKASAQLLGCPPTLSVPWNRRQGKDQRPHCARGRAREREKGLEPRAPPSREGGPAQCEFGGFPFEISPKSHISHVLRSALVPL